MLFWLPKTQSGACARHLLFAPLDVALASVSIREIRSHLQHYEFFAQPLDPVPDLLTADF
jgi:hypothetical protein